MITDFKPTTRCERNEEHVEARGDHLHDQGSHNSPEHVCATTGVRNNSRDRVEFPLTPTLLGSPMPSLAVSTPGQPGKQGANHMTMYFTRRTDSRAASLVPPATI